MCNHRHPIITRMHTEYIQTITHICTSSHGKSSHWRCITTCHTSIKRSWPTPSENPRTSGISTVPTLSSSLSNHCTFEVYPTTIYTHLIDQHSLMSGTPIITIRIAQLSELLGMTQTSATDTINLHPNTIDLFLPLIMASTHMYNQTYFILCSPH